MKNFAFITHFSMFHFHIHKTLCTINLEIMRITLIKNLLNSNVDNMWRPLWVTIPKKIVYSIFKDNTCLLVKNRKYHFKIFNFTNFFLKYLVWRFKSVLKILLFPLGTSDQNLGHKYVLKIWPFLANSCL